MLFNKNIQVLIHLSLINDIGPATIFRILKKLLLDQGLCPSHAECADLIGKMPEIDLEALYQYSTIDFENKFQISQKQAEVIEKTLGDGGVIDEELCLLEKHGIKIVSIFDGFYPESLRHIDCPPIILYYRGQAPTLKFKGLAVVGARAANEYAYQVIQEIVPKLVLNNWSIVSGGAIGADTMAHKVALDSGGHTIAVLGSGLLKMYPQDNFDLFKSIVEKGGTLISPFNLNAEPDKWRFPARNRIISGLSQGCLVVQAALKSGALITAKNALDQGRQVFAVPGRVDEKLSVGCNTLIKQGAKLVSDANDILEEFGEGLPSGLYKPAVTTHELQSSIYDAALHDVVLCNLADVLSIDELAFKTGLELDELQDRLFQLQIEGKVRQTFTGAWERC